MFKSTLLAMLGVAILASCGNDAPQTTTPTPAPTTQVTPAPKPAPSPSNSLHKPALKPLSFKGKPVILTKHAKCRMECREIEQTEIQEVIDANNINKKKSEPNPTDPSRCPSWAYEGDTHDGQRVRVIVAECDTEAKIVTVIDLKTDFECTCD